MSLVPEQKGNNQEGELDNSIRNNSAIRKIKYSVEFSHRRYHIFIPRTYASQLLNSLSLKVKTLSIQRSKLILSIFLIFKSILNLNLFKRMTKRLFILHNQIEILNL